MRLGLLLRHTLAVMMFTCVGGCQLFDTTCDEDDRECLSSGIFGTGLGGECRRTADCKTGLYCEDGTCNARGDTARGDECRLTAECGDDDYCGSQRVCTLAGLTEEGESCQSTGDCRRGLVCNTPDLSEVGTLSLDALATLSGECDQAGTLEQGEPCEDITECLAGLTCIPTAQATAVLEGLEDIDGLDSFSGFMSEDGVDKRCGSLPPTDIEIPLLPGLWDGVECAEIADDATAESFFEVPRDGDEVTEFYRLPFPNDIRRRANGAPDMSGHPTPPTDFGLPFVERYIEIAEQDLDGFSTNPVVYFRFSHEYSFGSVNGSTVKIVDITPGSDGYDEDASIEWKVTSGDLSNYICPHWLGLRRPIGSPLDPGTTYAAIVTTGLRTDNDSTFARGADFGAMLGSSEPSDPDLAAAWEKYEPLRDWIDDTNVNPDSILNATVFTTQNVETAIAGARSDITSTNKPTVSDLTVCESSSTVSPCEDAEGRGACRAASDDFIEIHGRIALPRYQDGTLPYETPEDGGGFVFDGDTPQRQGTEDVCFAMSVPTAAAPSGGYPVLIYAHGTGGVFNGQMGSNGYAQFAATASTPSIVLAIDMPMHGERKGSETDKKEDELFFNFLNPRAARDNVLQGSADLIALAYFTQAGGIEAQDSPTGEAIPFDEGRVALMGHSQGGTHTAVMLPYAQEASGAVLSGTGGHLATSLLTKTSPVNIAAVIPLGLLDPDDDFNLAAGDYNPALSIIQMVFDRADPINYARRVRRSPTDVLPTGMHVMMTYGVGDTFSTEETLQAYARAGFFTHVEPVIVDFGLPLANAPLMNNATVGGMPRTIGMRQYTPSGDTDGHFVATRSDQPGRPDVEAFLEAVLNFDPPEIGAQ
jgi:hypothetical protein